MLFAMLGYSQSTLQLFTQANLRLQPNKRVQSCYDEGYDLKGDEFYTVWAKLKHAAVSM